MDPLAVQSGQEHRTDQLTSLEVLQVGGSRMPDEVARKVKPVLGCTLQQVFGMAEGLINMTRLDDPEEVICTTQGRPVSEADEVRITATSPARSPADIIFRDELALIARGLPGFRLAHLCESDAGDAGWSGYRGRLSPPLLAAAAPALVTLGWAVSLAVTRELDWDLYRATEIMKGSGYHH